MSTTLDVIIGATRSFNLGITGGITYSLSDRVEFIHLGNDGLGLPDFERCMESGPLQDGASDLGFTLKPRSLQLVLNLVSSTELEYWQLRTKILSLFKPRADPIYLKFVTPVRTYYLECFSGGALTLPSTDKQSYKGHKLVVQLTALDPLFFGPIISGVLLAGTQTDVQTNPPYTGTYKTHPVFGIDGPITDCRIYLKSGTGDVLHTIHVTGTVAFLDSITIDLRYGYKNAYHSFTLVSAMDQISLDSDLSLAIYPSDETGTTLFRTTGSGTGSTTNVYFVTDPKYIGL